MQRYSVFQMRVPAIEKAREPMFPIFAFDTVVREYMLPCVSFFVLLLHLLSVVFSLFVIILRIK